MKLREAANIMGKANQTNLTGGKLPNVYNDNAESQSKLPRTKKKDIFGGNGMATSVNTGGDSGGDAGASTGGASTGGASTGGATGGGSGGGSGGGAGGGGGGA